MSKILVIIWEVLVMKARPLCQTPLLGKDQINGPLSEDFKLLFE